MSTFGSELTALKVAFEITIEMRYKLRMMGVDVKGPTIMFGDNLSVVNIGRADSRLKKKQHACSYGFCRECIAARIGVLIHRKSSENKSDTLTKALPPHLMYNLISPLLFNKG